MNVGMLWHDDDKRSSFEEKIKRAADYYQHKFGTAPNTCLVNVKALQEELDIGSIHVSPARNVLPHHFWIGVDQANTN